MEVSEDEYMVEWDQLQPHAELPLVLPAQKRQRSVAEDKDAQPLVQGVATVAPWEIAPSEPFVYVQEHETEMLLEARARGALGRPGVGSIDDVGADGLTGGGDGTGRRCVFDAAVCAEPFHDDEDELALQRGALSREQRKTLTRAHLALQAAKVSALRPWEAETGHALLVSARAPVPQDCRRRWQRTLDGSEAERDETEAYFKLTALSTVRATQRARCEGEASGHRVPACLVASGSAAGIVLVSRLG